MKPFDIEAAKNGAPVCTRDGRKVRIVCDNRQGSYPIIALLRRKDCDIEYVQEYSLQGITPAFTAELQLFMYEKPEHQFKPFDKVLVREGVTWMWAADLFSHKDGDRFCTMGGSSWDYCIPYEGNEALLGTTDSPKEA